MNEDAYLEEMYEDRYGWDEPGYDPYYDEWPEEFADDDEPETWDETTEVFVPDLAEPPF
jgi:hypothetical protein